MPQPKRNLSPKAIRLLRRVEKHILAEPRRYNQYDYGGPDNNSPCGAAACIAGWIDVLATNPRPSKRFLHRWSMDMYGERVGFYGACSVRAAQHLGVPVESVRGHLFSGRPDREWPDDFAIRWRSAATPSQRAKVAVARIEHFIETDGRE